MENNWPETIDELLDECQRLISKYDLYTLGERGAAFHGETEPRVDGTDYLAGEYKYGVAMIPAQWVMHVLSNAELGSGTLTAEQVRKAIRKYAHDDSCYIFEVYGEMCGPIADELNARLCGGECEETCYCVLEDEHDVCSECGEPWEYVQNYCPNCGRKVEK